MGERWGEKWGEVMIRGVGEVREEIKIVKRNIVNDDI